MCGIFSVMCKDLISWDTLKILFEGANKRGNSGTGLSIYGYNIKDNKLNSEVHIKHYKSWRHKETREYVKKEFQKYEHNNYLNPNNNFYVILGQQRQRPETEIQTNEENILKSTQPVINDKYGFCLVHNGAISNHITDEYKDYYEYVSELDSETIGMSYFKHAKNLKKVSEELVGGFASILFNIWNGELNVMVSHNPLSYLRKTNGDWYFHSYSETLEEIEEISLDDLYTNVRKIKPYSYLKLKYNDLYNKIEFFDNGVFTPNYYHPIYEETKKRIEENYEDEMVLISASGGLDSCCTAYILEQLGYKVKLVHFNLNQKSEEAELESLKEFAKATDMEFQIIEIGELFKEIDRASMISKSNNIDVTSGNFEIIKTASTWQANRNTIFYSILVAIAETEITMNGYSKVYIAGGFANLTESLTFPDNSEPWADAMIDSCRVGSIHGTKIKQLNVLRNCTKTEEIALVDRLGMPHELTCSCDNARIKYDNVELCVNCQSTALSRLAFKIAGVKDKRHFYDDGSGNGKYWIDLLEGDDVKYEEQDLSEIVYKLNLPNKIDYETLLRWID